MHDETEVWLVIQLLGLVEPNKRWTLCFPTFVIARQHSCPSTMAVMKCMTALECRNFLLIPRQLIDFLPFPQPMRPRYGISWLLRVSTNDPQSLHLACQQSERVCSLTCSVEADGGRQTNAQAIALSKDARSIGLNVTLESYQLVSRKWLLTLRW